MKKRLFFLWLLFGWCWFYLSGCAQMYTASTEVSFKNGEWYYKSNKNQSDLAAEIGMDDDGRVYGKIKTTSSTPESAIAAALESNRMALEILQSAIKSGAKFAPVP